MTLTVIQGSDSNAIDQIVTAINAGGSGGSAYLGNVTKSVGVGGDFETLDELQVWMDANRGKFLVINVLGTLAAPTGGMLFTNNFVGTFFNGVAGSELNQMIVFGQAGLSGIFNVKGDLTFAQYSPNIYNTTATLTSTGASKVTLLNCAISGGTVYFDEKIEVENSTFYILRANELKLKTSTLFTYEVHDDSSLSCTLEGNNTITNVDARNKTISNLFTMGGGVPLELAR